MRTYMNIMKAGSTEAGVTGSSVVKTAGLKNHKSSSLAGFTE